MASASGSAALGLRLAHAVVDVGYRPRLHDSVPCPHAHRRPSAGRTSRPRRRRWDARTADGLDSGGPTLTLWTARAALIIAWGRESIRSRARKLRRGPRAHFGVICELIISTPR